MSKEVIINGIDVSECDAYKDKHCMDKTSIMFCNLNTCSNFPNCSYKQLKRMQVENEQLKQRLSNCEKFFNELNELLGMETGCAYWQQLVLNNIKTLQAENEELKKRQITKNGFICDCEQNEKYRQALEEIKEIANKAINSDDCYERMYARRMYCKPILTKINEVLDEQ